MMTKSGVSVLMVVDSLFPAVQGGGAESQVRTLGLEFLQRGIPVQVVAPMIAGGPQGTHDVVDGIAVHRIAYPYVRLLGGAWLLAALVVWLVRERSRYDVIHAHIAGNMAAVCCIVGRMLGKPVLVKLTGMYEMQRGMLSATPARSVRLRSRALSHASAYQAISERIAGLLVERGFEARKVRRIPNAVNVARFEALELDPALRGRLRGDATRVGVFVGRLEREKGLEFLLEGWARGLRGQPATRLLMVGDGSERAALEASCRRLGIADQIVFTGSTEQVEAYLAAADFGVLSSLTEGLSNTLLEYMAAGLPVLGTKVSGTEDFVVDGRTGWLVPPADAHAVAEALCDIGACGDDELMRRGAEARALVAERASIGAVVDQLLGTWEALRAPPLGSAVRRGAS
jgi:glycosyltransferase involved in cell wall biosynthesis